MEQIKLSNGTLTVTISTMGAEMQSIEKNGCEVLWNGDAAFWTGRAPVLFPICGGLRDDKFIFEGKEYTIPKHGYARKTEFLLEKASDTSATFLLTSNEESLKKLPFSYELRITYTLEGDRVRVRYDVTNTGNKTMYFSIGSHEGYACPEGIEEYSVIFEKEEALSATVLNGNLLEYKANPVPMKGRELPLSYDFFAIDALVFADIKSRKATLLHRPTGRRVTVEFPDRDFLFIWTKPGAPYLCIEPWAGLPDYVDSDYDITKKRGIIALPAGKTDTREHRIIMEN